jgi:hypothetical protein
MKTGIKRFILYYESDRKICNSYEHEGGRANSQKTIKQYISNIKRDQAEYNPRNFYIVDTEGGNRND